MMIRLLIGSLFVGLVCGAVATTAKPLTIFAAASLQGPLDTIAETWGAETRISYAGSGTLARQISLGAPADVAILANPQWMDWLAQKGLLHSPVRDITSNRLVVIGPIGAEPLEGDIGTALAIRLGTSARLAMGQHRSVPAGIYAAAWLKKIGAWSNLRTRLAETDSVRTALALVTRAEVPLGIVYASDAQTSKAVKVVFDVPPTAHPPIRYPAAAITEEGRAFVDHLITQSALFVAAGFVALP